jgi:fatty acid desaturase
MDTSSEWLGFYVGEMNYDFIRTMHARAHTHTHLVENNVMSTEEERESFQTDVHTT